MGKRLFLAAILMGCIMGMEAKSLKKAYRKYFDIGVAVNLRNVTDEMQGALVQDLPVRIRIVLVSMPEPPNRILYTSSRLLKPFRQEL